MLAYRTSKVKRATLLIVMAKAPHRRSYFHKCLGHGVSACEVVNVEGEVEVTTNAASDGDD